MAAFLCIQWSSGLFLKKIAGIASQPAQCPLVCRFFFSGATECELDKQGRVMLPPNLREYGHLTKEVIITGAGNRLEIWDKAVRDAYVADSQSPEELAAAMSDMGFLI